MKFFRTYIRLKDKASLDKFKDCDAHTLEEVQDLPSYGGVLSGEVTLIDVDDRKQADRLLEIVEAMDIKCQVRRTDRGGHFYFKADPAFDKCGGNKRLAIGLNADIKMGKNSYACLKKDGRVRAIVYDKFPEEEYDTPPVWLRVVNSSVDVFDLGDGDGRNDALFRLIMPLQSAGLNKKDIIETLQIINTYIFNRPLSQSEFESVTRDDAFETAIVPSFFGEKGKFLFEQFGNYIIKEHHIKRINGQIHYYDGKVYIQDQLRIEKLLLDVIPDLTKRQRSEVLSYIDVMCTSNVPMADAKFCAFTNGVLDMDTLELMSFNPEYVLTNLIPWDYNRGAYSAVVDKMLTKVACNDREVRDLLEEAAGSLLYRRNELRKSFILTGGARGGKSSYINMLGAMLGDKNMSALDLNDLSGNRFRLAELFGKLGNLGDDISDNFIEDMSIFKKLVSGDKVMAEHKGERPFFFSNYAKFIFSANDMPRLRDKSSAALDRMIVIPFEAEFSSSDPDYDPFISDKLKTREAIEYLIKLGVDAFCKVRKRKKFTESKKVNKKLNEYNEENNPVLVFLNELDADELTREPIGTWYTKYCGHCIGYGCNPISRIAFSKMVCQKFGMESKVRKIDGRTHRFFAKVTDS